MSMPSLVVAQRAEHAAFMGSLNHHDHGYGEDYVVPCNCSVHGLCAHHQRVADEMRAETAARAARYRELYPDA